MQIMSNRYIETIRLKKRQEIEPMNDVRGNGRGTAGFTLMELVLVLAIMLLAGIIVATGLPAAMRAYESAVDAANAQVMLSDSVSRLRNVLSTADPQKVNEFEADAIEAGLRPKINDEAQVFVSFRSLGTGYLTAIAGGGSEGIQVIEMPVDWAGQPKYNLAQVMPLIPDMKSIMKTGSLYTKVDEINAGESGVFNGVFTVKGLAVIRSGSDQPIPSASIKGDGLKIRIIVE